ncbi:antibiotic biosynthesis monooxygenase [bacterium]|nr:antibiotic biosynthesis monooxygenase [bacterium]
MDSVFFPHFPSQLPDPPYWAAVFLSERSSQLEGYAAMDQATIDAASSIPGYLGYASLKQGDVGMFISYWQNPEAIEAWRMHGLHLRAKDLGKAQWYRRYVSQLARIESHSLGGTQTPQPLTP